ncbi:MAG: hypothetical protein RL148_1222 [Planctomycetota bacterium]
MLPPLNGTALVLLGLALRRWMPRVGSLFAWAGALLLLVLSLPVTGGTLMATLQHDAALPAEGPLPAAEAIVVVSAESDTAGAEFGGPTVGRFTLQRVRYAAALHRRTGLPVLTSGGVPARDVEPIAESMARTMEQELGATVRWRENRSADTWENARFSADLLREAGVRRILLVTHAFHMPRALHCFRAQGLEVVAAPTAFRGPAWEDLRSLKPSWSGMRDSSLALHEHLGMLWYRLSGRR